VEQSNAARQPLRIVARQGCAWKDFVWDTSRGFFVSKNTQSLQLARKLAMDLRAGESVTLHAYADSEHAVAGVLRALATVPRLEGGAPLKCSAGSLEQGDEHRRRVVVHARAERTAQAAAGEEFLAWTPGPKADEQTQRRFANTVRQRMEMGWTVAMVCRGAEATVQAMAALASVRQRTAEFEVRWADGIPRPGSDDVPRELRVRAVSGATWSDFNATEFSRTRLLRATEETSIKLLARDVGREVKQRGGVAVHAYSDSPLAVSRAVKALASVPIEDGSLRVRAVPSFGWSSAGDHSGERRRCLRFFVRRAAVEG